jgi:hypothetical protein
VRKTTGDASPGQAEDSKLCFDDPVANVLDPPHPFPFFRGEAEGGGHGYQIATGAIKELVSTG